MERKCSNCFYRHELDFGGMLSSSEDPPGTTYPHCFSRAVEAYPVELFQDFPCIHWTEIEEIHTDDSIGKNAKRVKDSMKSLAHGMVVEYLHKLIAEEGAWIGLSLTEITANGTGFTEPSGGYSRVEIGKDDVHLYKYRGYTKIKNIKHVVFSKPTKGWGTVRYFCIFDSKENGNLLAFSELGSPVDIFEGFTARFDPDSIVISG